MNQSTFQLLGNVASADFYLCEGSDITLISDNNAYNMKALAQEALKLRVPNSLILLRTATSSSVINQSTCSFFFFGSILFKNLSSNTNK